MYESIKYTGQLRLFTDEVSGETYLNIEDMYNMIEAVRRLAPIEAHDALEELKGNLELIGRYEEAQAKEEGPKGH